jgi:hypothetical protein
MTLSIWPADRCELGRSLHSPNKWFHNEMQYGQAALKEDWRLKKPTGFCLTMPQATRELMGAMPSSLFVRRRSPTFWMIIMATGLSVSVARYCRAITKR